MRIKHLELKNYRNYFDVSLDFTEKTIIFTGNNGQGKTNILESIYYLSSGRSHKSTAQNEILNWESDYFLIRAVLEDKEDDRLIEIQARKDNDIKIKIDGVLLKKKSAFTSLVDTVIFSPEDLVLVKGPPANRRNFMDDMIEKTDRSFAELRYKYQKIIAQRNSMLKSAFDAAALRKNRTFDIWNENIIKTGLQIIQRRLEMLDILQKKCAVHMDMFFKGAQTEMHYLFSWQKDQDSVSFSNDLEKAYRESLSKSLSREIILKNTLIGPHRDDILLFFNGRQIKNYGSQGQQRAASISLKLAELAILEEKNKRLPILLLDDALSELDESRKQFLLALISDKAQTFITAANVKYIGALDGIEKQCFLIKDNHVYHGTELMG